jgi:hypothetical protein
VLKPQGGNCAVLLLAARQSKLPPAVFHTAEGSWLKMFSRCRAGG